MQTEMKCPTCGGDKYKFLGGNTFKCAYCGATFVNEQQAPEAEKEIVYVQAPPQPQYQQAAPQQPYVQSNGKSKGVAAVLAFFLGGLGMPHSMVVMAQMRFTSRSLSEAREGCCRFSCPPRLVRVSTVRKCFQ